MKKIIALALLSAFSIGFSQKQWSLQECVDYALKNNLQVISNQYNTDIQAKNLAISKNQKLPSVVGGFNNNMGFGTTQGFQGSIGRNDNFNNSASLNANLQLYNNGKIQKTVEKSQYDLDASMLDTEKVKNDISLNIAQLYLQVLLNKEVKRITDASVVNAEKVLLRAKMTTEAGTTPKTVEAEAVAGLAREKQKQKSAEIDIQRSLFSLAILLQLKDYQSFDVQQAPTIEMQAPLLTSTEDILNKAFENQPQVKAAEIRILSAQKQTEIAKTAFYPTFTAFAGLGSFYYYKFSPTINPVTGAEVHESYDSFFKQYKDNFSQNVGINVNIPIFNKGITKLQVEQAKISESIAKVSLERQKIEVQQNVQKAFFDAQANYEVYSSASEAEKSTKLALDFAEKSYEAGKSTIYDLNIARNNYVSAQGSVAQAKYNYLFSIKLLNFYAGIPLSL